MEDQLRAHLETLAAAYAKAKGLEVATVAQRALGDWRFFERLQQNDRASFTVRKYDAALGWFEQHWPADVAWPAAKAA